MFVALGYSLIDEERKEGGKKNRGKWNLNTLLAERSTKERNMRAKTKSGSQDGLKSAVHSTLCVSVGGEIRLNLLQNIVSFLSYQGHNVPPLGIEIRSNRPVLIGLTGPML